MGRWKNIYWSIIILYYNRIMKMIKKVVLVILNGMEVENTLDIGEIINNMDQEFIQIQKVKKKQDYGKKV